jgi:dethiobiotin synthetase
LPRQVIVVSGTGTEVGKTWVGSALLRALRSEGVAVAARKPAQSFDPADGPTDADLLAAASGQSPHDVCPAHRWYERPMAPFMAAEALGRPPFTLADLVGELHWPEGVEVGLVEGAGGPLSPMASDGGDTADLAAILKPDLVLLVAEAGLGAINAVRLATRPFEPLAPVVVLLNRYDRGDGLHRANRDWLVERGGFDVRTDPATVTRPATPAP